MSLRADKLKMLGYRHSETENYEFYSKDKRTYIQSAVEHVEIYSDKEIRQIHTSETNCDSTFIRFKVKNGLLNMARGENVYAALNNLYVELYKKSISPCIAYYVEALFSISVSLQEDNNDYKVFKFTAKNNMNGEVKIKNYKAKNKDTMFNISDTIEIGINGENSGTLFVVYGNLIMDINAGTSIKIPNDVGNNGYTTLIDKDTGDGYLVLGDKAFSFKEKKMYNIEKFTGNYLVFKDYIYDGYSIKTVIINIIKQKVVCAFKRDNPSRKTGTIADVL